jgi:hypothetical protein
MAGPDEAQGAAALDRAVAALDLQAARCDSSAADVWALFCCAPRGKRNAQQAERAGREKDAGDRRG